MINCVTVNDNLWNFELLCSSSFKKTWLLTVCVNDNWFYCILWGGTIRLLQHSWLDQFCHWIFQLQVINNDYIYLFIYGTGLVSVIPYILPSLISFRASQKPSNKVIKGAEGPFFIFAAHLLSSIVVKRSFFSGFSSIFFLGSQTKIRLK